MNETKIILGIDPGYDRLGVAILKNDKNENELIFSTCIESNKKENLNQRIFNLCNELQIIIEKYKPNELSIEKLFFTTNQKTAMGVAESRGAVIYLSQKLGLKVSEFTPLEIKIALTGYGKADKNQVYFMLKKVLKLNDNLDKRLDDEYDAIAVAYTKSVIKN